MADVIFNGGTTFDDRGASGYSEDRWVDGLLRKLPAMTIPHCFNLDEDVLIWYCRDECWYEGKVVFRRSGLCEVEFRCADGPRLRDWYNPSCGFIRPDTISTRELLKAHGFVIIARAVTNP